MTKPGIFERFLFLALSCAAMFVAWKFFSEDTRERARLSMIVTPAETQEAVEKSASAISPEAGLLYFPGDIIPGWSKDDLKENFGKSVPHSDLKENFGKSVPHSEMRKRIFIDRGSAWLVKKTGVAKPLAQSIAKSAFELQHGQILLAMLTVESDARPDLKYGNNYGLCQVSDVHLEKKEMERVEKNGYKSLRECGVHRPRDLFDVKKNLCAADAVFGRIYKENGGDLKKALVKYNANPRHKHKYSREVERRYRELGYELDKTGIAMR